MMVDADRQVPASSGSVWLIDLAAIVGGPRFVIMRLDENEARDALVAHLVEIASIANTIEAERAVGAAWAEPPGVVW